MKYQKIYTMKKTLWAVAVLLIGILIFKYFFTHPKFIDEILAKHKLGKVDRIDVSYLVEREIPLGTSRKEAFYKLKKLGFDVSEGESESGLKKCTKCDKVFIFGGYIVNYFVFPIIPYEEINVSLGFRRDNLVYIRAIHAASK